MLAGAEGADRGHVRPGTERYRGETLLEVHLFDFDERIYGAYITVRFKARLRSEEKFASLEALKEQMHADVAAAKAALAE